MVIGQVTRFTIVNITTMFPSTRCSAVAVLSGFLGLCAPCVSQGQVLSVDGQSSDCNDTAGAPFCRIQTAIDRAPPGATVDIAPGTYELWGETLTVDKDLTLRGAGASQTILDGNGEHPGPLITITDTAARVDIASLSLVNRSRAGSYTAGAGGIDHFGQSLTVTDAAIRGNQGGVGGAIRAGSDFGSVKLVNVEISSNAAFVGGAVDFRDAPAATLEIADSDIHGNTAIFTGGGLFLRDVGTVTLTNVTVRENESGNQGGGIYVVAQTEGGNLEVRDSIITANWSKGSGGIAAAGDDVKVRLERVVLADNTSENEPAQSDCWAEFEDAFQSLGGNLVGNGDGCKFRAREGDSVGTTKEPMRP